MTNYNFTQRDDGAYDLSVSNNTSPTGVPPLPPGVPPPPAPQPPGVPPSPPSGPVTMISASQWKPEVGTASAVFGTPGVTVYCELITSGAVGVGPFRAKVPFTVLPGASTAGGNVAVIEFVEAPGERNAYARLSVSKDGTQAIYLTGDTNSGAASLCFGEDRDGATRLEEGQWYAYVEWHAYEGVSSNKVIKLTRFA